MVSVGDIVSETDRCTERVLSERCLPIFIPIPIPRTDPEVVRNVTSHVAPKTTDMK